MSDASTIISCPVRPDVALLVAAVILFHVGVASAGDNAGATLSITSPTKISDVGAGTPVVVSFAAAGMVNVKQFDIILEVTPASAFDLKATRFVQNSDLFDISPGVEFPDGHSGNQVKIEAARFLSPGASGQGNLGTITLTTSAEFAANMTATIRVVRFSLGPSSATRDVFTEMTQSVTVNPTPTSAVFTSSWGSIKDHP